MKMRSLSLLVATGLVSSTVAFAGQSVLSGYYSSQHPQTTLAAKATMFPPTDITVTNASSNTIFVVVPNSPINDTVYAGTNDHIRHNTYYGSTTISLQDPNHNQFWSGAVCRLALVTVYGTPGNYRTNVDNELCN